MGDFSGSICRRYLGIFFRGWSSCGYIISLFFGDFCWAFELAVGYMLACRCRHFRQGLFGKEGWLHQKLFCLMKCLLVACSFFPGYSLVVQAGGCSDG